MISSRLEAAVSGCVTAMLRRLSGQVSDASGHVSNVIELMTTYCPDTPAGVLFGNTKNRDESQFSRTRVRKARQVSDVIENKGKPVKFSEFYKKEKESTKEKEKRGITPQSDSPTVTGEARTSPLGAATSGRGPGTPCPAVEAADASF